MRIELLAGVLTLPIVVGVILTRIKNRRDRRDALARRLAKLSGTSVELPAVELLKQRDRNLLDRIKNSGTQLPGIDWLRATLYRSELEDQQQKLFLLTAVLFLAPFIIALVVDWSLLIALAVGLFLSALPWLYLTLTFEKRRDQFCEQLPNGLDLMIAVLRSGHSVSQAVKSVANEIPSPCGSEFKLVLKRMNLGQPLAQALVSSSQKYRSPDLDLVRRAVQIQLEVGGSLAELLEKTNGTLRERLKLARQLKTITAQSRLSAIIVAILPIVVAIALNILSPGYIETLVRDELGRMLLTVCVVLEISGIIIMNRMATVKV